VDVSVLLLKIIGVNDFEYTRITNLRGKVNECMNVRGFFNVSFLRKFYI